MVNAGPRHTEDPSLEEVEARVQKAIQRSRQVQAEAELILADATALTAKILIAAKQMHDARLALNKDRRKSEAARASSCRRFV